MNMERKIYEKLIQRYPELKALPIRNAYEILLECSVTGGRILVCGNGGSASDAEHIVGELMKGFKLKRGLNAEEVKAFVDIEDGAVIAAKLQKAIPAISLNSHVALMTAVGNDTDYDMVFAQQVYGYGRPGDVLIAMTTSGNSANVVNAAKTAAAVGMKVIGITGRRDSRLSAVSDICLKMPAEETYLVQEYTLPVYHALCAMLEEKLFG